MTRDGLIISAFRDAASVPAVFEAACSGTTIMRLTALVVSSQPVP